MNTYFFALFLTALATIGYTVGTLFVKGAMYRGAKISQINLTVNFALALVMLPLWIFHRSGDFQASLPIAFLTGFGFFLGQVFIYAALVRGDVSIATPLLGTKIILVTVLNTALFALSVSFRWWIAALTASLATAIIAGGMPRGKRRKVIPTVLFSLSAAGSYSFVDVLIQHFAAGVNPYTFSLQMFSFTAVISTVWYALIDRSAFQLRGKFFPMLLCGAVLLGCEGGAYFISLVLAQDATAVNVIYSLRSLLSVVFAWVFGTWFGFQEAVVGRKIMLQRVIGACLLLVAILLVLMG